MMGIDVRRATQADAPALVELRRTLFSQTSNMMFEPAEFTSTPDDEAARIARLNGRPNAVVAAAFDDDARAAVGLISAVGGEARRLRHSVTLALGVRRSHWHRGVGTALLRFVLAWSRTVPLKRLELTVHTTNTRAFDLYRRMGFAVEGTRRASLLVDGRYVDEYLMSIVHPDITPDAHA
jgi:RimJ/RimL family protein N-acetyltransferase